MIKIQCPHCGNDSEDMIECLNLKDSKFIYWLCGVCSKMFSTEKDKSNDSNKANNS